MQKQKAAELYPPDKLVSEISLTKFTEPELKCVLAARMPTTQTPFKSHPQNSPNGEV